MVAYSLSSIPPHFDVFGSSAMFIVLVSELAHQHSSIFFSFLQVHNVHDLERVMELGGKNRSVGATLMNVDSSRSHSIFSIDVEMLEGVAGGEDRLRVGRLNLVDLAGSERQSKTGSTGEPIHPIRVCYITIY